MDTIIELFNNGHGEYSRKLQFKTIIIGVVIIITLNYYFRDTTINVIVIIFFVIAILNTYLKMNYNAMDDTNNMLMYKLNKIREENNNNIKLKIDRIKSSKINSKEFQLVITKLYTDNKLDFLYTDARLISFIYSILPLSKWNGDEFFSFLKGVNNILRLKYEIDNYYKSNGEYPINTSEMLESALELRVNTTNNLHNFIYSVPKLKMMTDYIDKVLFRYSQLMTYNIVSIYNSYKENNLKRGITNSTKFINLNHPKPIPDNNNMVYI
jgi:hypothetical protein